MAFPHLLRLIIAGILAIPALLLLITIAPIIVLLSLPSLAILVRRKRNLFPSFDTSQLSESSFDSTNNDKGHKTHPLLQHAVITGGSSGIGLSIAIELAKQRCRHITLLARNEQQLIGAKLLVEKAAAVAATTTSKVSSTTTTSVHILSVDVTDFSALEKAVANHISSINNTATPGQPTLLFHCAGMSIPLAFEDLSASNFYKQMNVNYLGSVHVVKAFLPYMTNTTQQQKHSIGGNIILTSSMSGQTGTFGYSGYSPTKFALRGFAECLSMELAAKKSNVNISLAYPPDTKTPGYEIENRNKPEECRLISEGSGIWDPDV